LPFLTKILFEFLISLMHAACLSHITSLPSKHCLFQSDRDSVLAAATVTESESPLIFLTLIYDIFLSRNNPNHTPPIYFPNIQLYVVLLRGLFLSGFPTKIM
jgi:hypothetical protein